MATGWSHYLYGLILCVSIILLGVVLKYLLLSKFKVIASKTKWKGDDIVVDAISRFFLWYFLILGLFAADKYLVYPPFYKEYVSKTLLVATILVFTLTFSRIVSQAVSISGGKARGLNTSSSILKNISYAIVFLLGFTIILNTLGISIAPLITALGIGGLAVALALQNTLSNLFAGLHILASNDLNPGNFIRLEGGEEGFIVDIKWRNTTIRTLSNSIIVVPNAKLADMKVINLSLPDKEISVLFDVEVAFNSDLDKVEKVTVEAASQIMKQVPGTVKNFEPFIRYGSFKDSSIQFTVIMRAKEFTDQFLIKHEFLKLLYSKYAENNIVIPFPERTIHLVENKTLKHARIEI